VGALIFYTFVFFIGFFFAHGFTLLTKRDFLNRRWTGLVCVLMMAALHGYKILNTEPPNGHADEIMQALGYYVILPVSVIVVALLYLRWRDQDDRSNSH